MSAFLSKLCAYVTPVHVSYLDRSVSAFVRETATLVLKSVPSPFFQQYNMTCGGRIWPINVPQSMMIG